MKQETTETINRIGKKKLIVQFIIALVVGFLTSLILLK